MRTNWKTYHFRTQQPRMTQKSFKYLLNCWTGYKRMPTNRDYVIHKYREGKKAGFTVLSFQNTFPRHRSKLAAMHKVPKILCVCSIRYLLLQACFFSNEEHSGPEAEILDNSGDTHTRTHTQPEKIFKIFFLMQIYKLHICVSRKKNHVHGLNFRSKMPPFMISQEPWTPARLIINSSGMTWLIHINLTIKSNTKLLAIKSVHYLINSFQPEMPSVQWGVRHLH